MMGIKALYLFNLFQGMGCTSHFCVIFVNPVLQPITYYNFRILVAMEIERIPRGLLIKG